jgi:2-polyprenyl-6-methoxyphenol hydroxylase-like FAD-dependent oxidoreductase
MRERLQAERVLIVGAGIAGLAVAGALRKRGVRVELIERATQPVAAGAGIYLVGIGTRALRALGAADAALREGQVIATQTFFNRRGTRLADVDVLQFWSECGPCLGVERAVLHRALAEKAAGVDLRFGVTLQSLRQDERQVAVDLSDGTSGTYDFVVGADGIRSSVRRLELGAAEPRFRGQVGWRFLAQCPSGISGWTVYLHTDRAFLLVPIGGGRAYCYADRVAARPVDDPPEGRIERLRQSFREFPAAVGEALASIESAHQVHYAPIEEVASTSVGRGRVLLVGDAAHAMSPNMACGAALALEDALVLADIMAGTAPGVASQLLHRRSPRIDWVRRQTDKRDRLRALPGMARDLSLRLLAAKIYAGNYRPLLLPA